MEFKIMSNKFEENFKTISGMGNMRLFEVAVDKDELWNLYINSFPEGTNNIYRKRRKYDCSCCRQFIKNIGGTVLIDSNLDIHTIFGFDTGSEVFQQVFDILDTYVKSKVITDLYLHDSHNVGTASNKELLSDGTVKTWDHFHLTLPDLYVEKRKNIAFKKGLFRDRRNVFKRSLDEISIDAINIVLELISSKTLYRGEEWKDALEYFKKYKEEYEILTADKKELYAWYKSSFIGDTIGKIRNHSIGFLLVDISEGIDLDVAVRRYEKIVAPSNYKRPKAIFTKRMLEEAKQTITDLGYMHSLPRRYATLDDITVNNILFSNKDAAKRISGDVFDDMMADIPVKQFSRVEEVSIDTFVNDILPTVKEMELLLENKHAVNMVSLIAPVNKEAPSMFKWNNGFSWAYSGNITDSDIRERVKNAGGNIEGDLRFSIQWNDGTIHDRNDLDAHCIEPSCNRIYFGSKCSRDGFGGYLDVDITTPIPGIPAVENIAWPNKKLMKPGEYLFMVHQYRNRGGRGGFRAEIEFDGQIHKYDYNKELHQNEAIDVATVTLDENGKFTIKHHLDHDTASREVWGLKTNTFVPVTVMMYSPNYWDDQTGIGHRHYFFMLKDCVNPECPNGFYNEFLKHDLDKHKRVLEALGGKMAVAAADDQLSGLGFSATKRNDVTVKVKGASERVIKIKF